MVLQGFVRQSHEEKPPAQEVTHTIKTLIHCKTLENMYFGQYLVLCRIRQSPQAPNENN